MYPISGAKEFATVALGGFVRNVWLVLPASIAMMLTTLLIIRTVQKEHF